MDATFNAESDPINGEFITSGELTELDGVMPGAAESSPGAATDPSVLSLGPLSSESFPQSPRASPSASPRASPSRPYSPSSPPYSSSSSNSSPSDPQYSPTSPEYSPTTAFGVTSPRHEPGSPNGSHTSDYSTTSYASRLLLYSPTSLFSGVPSAGAAESSLSATSDAIGLSPTRSSSVCSGQSPRAPCSCHSPFRSQSPGAIPSPSSPAFISLPDSSPTSPIGVASPYRRPGSPDSKSPLDNPSTTSCSATTSELVDVAPGSPSNIPLSSDILGPLRSPPPYSRSRTCRHKSQHNMSASKH